MKLLTLNCHSWQEENQLEKIQIIAESIKEKGYDVIALQEVSQSINEPTIVGNIKRDHFGYILLNELEKLGIHDYNMTWDLSHMAYNIYEEGLCLLTKHDIINKHSFFASNSQDINYGTTRKIVGATLRIDDQFIDFYSCHLGWWNDAKEPFKEQIDRLLASIPLDKPTFLMGDFNNNALIRAEGYDYLLQKGWYDTFDLAVQKDSGMTVQGKIAGWEKNKQDMRIDLILVNEKIEVASSYVVFNGDNQPIVSDHYGVEVEVLI